MESGRRTSTPPQTFPTVKHLVWALVAGTALVVSGTRDGNPPQPPRAHTVPAPAPAASGASPGTAAPPTGRSPEPAAALAYMAPSRPAPAPPAFVSPAPVPPALAPPPAVRPAPLRPAPALPAAPTAATPAPGRSVPPSAVQPLPRSEPVRLRIPAIGVDAPLMRLALDAAGALQPPPDNNPVLAGWYAGGTAPGSVGTAITAGHVDTRLGPGVFQELGFVREGATVEIIRADLTTAVFTVYAVEVYDKGSFPDKKVYGASARPELRVITCGGDYSKKTGYRSNVVVFAALTGQR
ncbi:MULTISPECIES: class F sortase [Streptomyces]|uniref:class F sortase n=1 Tax=Streptomyces TaxID=1883 RepID=UPI0006F97963|nr:peptidase C60 sortase A and B [Streptomyces sp. Root1319]KQZ20110.1 peptidase C60 sortase A and B [Streptomyces sp. Root55]